MQTRRITTIEEAEKKVHARESQIDEVMEEEETLMEELRKQQEDIVRQVISATSPKPPTLNR